MSDHLKMPVHEQWTCGHIATAMCLECYQELARKANHLIAENERLRAVIVRSKDALLDGQSTQRVHDLLVGALHKDEHRGGMPFGGQSL